MRNVLLTLLLGTVSSACNGDQAQSTADNPTNVTGKKAPVVAKSRRDIESEIRGLIERLVFADGPASNRPIVGPYIKIFDAEGNSKPHSGESDDAEKRRQKFCDCQEAFNKLYEMKAAAIPIMVEHLDDKRQSINFRNHRAGNSVGHACYWNIYYQLQDRPRDYSRYGYSRAGRDGEDHPKPYWTGTPFDDAGGLEEWLEENRDLNYVEMQIKCLNWLLEREKLIGAPDADSYFLNILPLEIRILERRSENGEDVEGELKRLIDIRDNKLADQIPKDLLPER